MQPKDPLRLFVNPLAIWTGLAFKTGEAMLASVHAASARANAPRVAAIPAAAKARAAVRSKTRTGGKAKRRAKR